MQKLDIAIDEGASRAPWNKGKLLGAKPPLRTKHVWAIRTKLQVEGRTRDLAMFNLAIDSKLRGCDVVSLKVEDVAPQKHGQQRIQALRPPSPFRQDRRGKADPVAVARSTTIPDLHPADLNRPDPPSGSCARDRDHAGRRGRDRQAA